FHHTYFPSADIFNVVPWRREILGSLLSCDYIGFHIPRQVENFVDVVRGAMPVEVLEREGCAPRFLTYGCAVGLESMVTRMRVGDREVAWARTRWAPTWAASATCWPSAAPARRWKNCGARSARA